MIPSWLVEAEAKAQRALARPEGGLILEQKDSFHTAPGWRTLDIEFSCIPDSEHPWDPKVLRKIWEFDRGVVPIWIRYIMLSPSNTGAPWVEVFGRHGIARYKPITAEDVASFSVTMPGFPCQGVRFNRPNVLEYIHTQRTDIRDASGVDLPGDYLPFDMSLYRFLKSAHDQHKDKSPRQIAIEMSVSQYEHHEKVKKQNAEEWSYRQKDLAKYVDKQLDKLSEVEMKDAVLGERSRANKVRLDLGS